MKFNNCKKCGIKIILNSPVQKYCKNCSIKVIRENTNSNARLQRSINKPKKILLGTTLNILQPKSGITWKFDVPEPDYNLLFSFKVPFDQNLSKNNMKRYFRGHYYLNPSTRAAKDEIIYRVKSAKIPWVQTKTYLEIFVEKPNNRTDAINFVDTIADAISTAIQVNDRWFCIGRVDWQIKKNNPYIYVTVKQDSNNPLAACHNCGRLLPPKTIKRRTCSDCIKFS